NFCSGLHSLVGGAGGGAEGKVVPGYGDARFFLLFCARAVQNPALSKATPAFNSASPPIGNLTGGRALLPELRQKSVNQRLENCQVAHTLTHLGNTGREGGFHRGRAILMIRASVEEKFFLLPLYL
ncbi:UNVERIFIED_CONTAM: hypothetical protein K2H54_022898, partial [Gekko kuhli]